MKLLLTALTAATVTATSAFAVTTPEDRAMLAEQRLNGIEAIGQEVMVVPAFELEGRAAIFDESAKVTKTVVDNKTYDESNSVGRI